MSELKLSMLVEANARGASAEVKSLRAEVKGLTTDTRAGGDASRTAAQDAAALRAGMASLKAEVAGLAAAEAQGKAALQELTAAGQGQTTQARALEAELRTLATTQKALAAEERAANQAIAAQAVAFDQLKQSIDPAYAAQRRYEDQVEKVTRSVRLGIVTQEEGNRVLARARGQLGLLDGATTGVGQAAGNSSQLWKQLAFQVNQVGQSGAATGQWLTAATIQIPDILASFGSLPLVLAGGAIAVGASLIPALLGAGDAGEDAGKGVDEFTGALDRYQQYAATAQASTVSLRGEFGQFAEDMRAHAAWMSQVAIGDALGGLADTDLAGGMDQALAAVARLRAVQADVQAALDRGDALAAQTLNPALAMATADARLASADIGLDPEQVQAVADGLAAISDAGRSGDLDAVRATADGLLTTLQGFYVSGAQVPTQVVDATQQLYDVLNASSQALATQGAEVDAAVVQAQTLGAEYASTAAIIANLGEARELHAMLLATAANAAEAGKHSAAIAAIDQRLAAMGGSAVAAERDLDSMDGTLDRLISGIADADLTGPEWDAVVALARELGVELEDARDNVGDLNEADVSAIEERLRGLAELAERLSGGLVRAGDGLTDVPSFMQEYAYRANTGVSDARNVRLSLSEAAEKGILDLIRVAEGTQGEGRDLYNETLGRGVLLDGRSRNEPGAYSQGDPRADVALVNMTLREVLELQRAMLRDPDNVPLYGDPSSAVGAYQITATTLGGEAKDGAGGLIAALGLDLDQQFTPELQDRLAQELIRQRDGQGVGGLQSEWEGLQRVDPSLIRSALGQQVIPGTDPVVAREAEAAATREATEAQREHDQAVADGERIRAGLMTDEEAIAARKEELNAIVREGELSQADANEELARYTRELYANSDAAQLAAAAWAEAHDAMVERMDEVRDAGKEALGGILDDALAGASGLEILGNAAERLGQRLLDSGIDLFGDLLFGEQGSSGLGMLGALLGMGGGGGTFGSGDGSTAAINGAMEAIFSAEGNAFSQGELVAFAAGGAPGLSDFSSTVVTRPTLFGLMGEAGAEAILPLEGGEVGAVVGGREATLPLTRLRDGSLGVSIEPFAKGGVPGGRVVMEGAPAAWRQGSAAPSSGDAEAPEGSGGGTLNVHVDVTGAQGDQAIEDRVNAGVARALAAYDQRLHGRVKGIIGDWRRA